MRQGWIAAEVAGEFPDLRLYEQQIALPAPIGRSGDGVREQLRRMSDGFRGAQAIAMRTQPIHHAHRVFFRHIGIDPDRQRPPAEAIAVERLKRGAFKPTNALDDAILIAVMETGVPVWALDEAAVAGDLGIRPAYAGEEVGGLELPAGRLVVADARAPHAVLFGEVPRVSTRTASAIRLFCVQVGGVPSIHVEEAMWTVQDLLENPA